MAGNSTGGKQAAITNKQKYGEDFYANIGSIGGKNGTTGGFHFDKGKAVTAGAKGGKISRKGYKLIKKGLIFYTYRNTITGQTKKIRIKDL
jgi:general stress protein YciG